MVDHALNRDPTVKFMVEKMEEVLLLSPDAESARPQLGYSNSPDADNFVFCSRIQAGCPAGNGFVRIETCEAAVGGGFRPPDGVCKAAFHSCLLGTHLKDGSHVPTLHASVQVVICSNHLSAQEEVSHALVHELIHAYDHCRGADLDWTNCEHHACRWPAHAAPLLGPAPEMVFGAVLSGKSLQRD